MSSAGKGIAARTRMFDCWCIAGRAGAASPCQSHRAGTGPLADHWSAGCWGGELILPVLPGCVNRDTRNVFGRTPRGQSDQGSDPTNAQYRTHERWINPESETVWPRSDPGLTPVCPQGATGALAGGV